MPAYSLPLAVHILARPALSQRLFHMHISTAMLVIFSSVASVWCFGHRRSHRVLCLIAVESGALADRLDRKCNRNPAANPVVTTLVTSKPRFNTDTIHVQLRLDFSLCLANKALTPFTVDYLSGVVLILLPDQNGTAHGHNLSTSSVEKDTVPSMHPGRELVSGRRKKSRL